MIQDAVDALYGAELTEAEREGMEEVGIIFASGCCPMKDEDEEDDANDNQSDDHGGSLIYWLQKLDKI